MIHRFNYPAFRTAYLRAKSAQRNRAAQEEQANALVMSTVRPTEFAAELWLRLARSRLWLTTLEKRVLHYDRLYMKRAPWGEESNVVSRERAFYIASRAGCPSSQVTSILEQLEWLIWAADTLEVTLNTEYARCARRRVAARQKVR